MSTTCSSLFLEEGREERGNNFTFFKRRELVTTHSELALMAAAAIIGFNNPYLFYISKIIIK